MLGSIIKYATAAAVGAIAFTTTAFFMDADVVEVAKAECATYAETVAALPEDERKERMKAFILINRPNWVAKLTFATSVDDLDKALVTWA